MTLSKVEKIAFGFLTIGLPLFFVLNFLMLKVSGQVLDTLDDKVLAAQLLIYPFLIFSLLVAVAGIYIIAKLIFSTSFRENLMKSLLFMKERDEREEIITAEASKSSFIFTMAMIIALLILNFDFNFGGENQQKSRLVNKKTEWETSHISYYTPNFIVYRNKTDGQDTGWKYHVGSEEEIAEIRGVELHKSTAINYKVPLILVLFTQIASYFYFAKRAEKTT